jgi:hypothetical protein
MSIAARGLTRQLQENGADMRAMGLQTRNSAGQLGPMNDLLADAIELLNQHKEGADRTLAAQQLFGRGVDASSKLLLVNRDILHDATATMQELGLEVGANAVPPGGTTAPRPTAPASASRAWPTPWAASSCRC